jgi:hypothetical protein
MEQKIMSDFFKLVQKLNDIEENKETSVVTESAPSTKPVEVAETASLLNKFNAISAENPYTPVVAEAQKAEVEETDDMATRYRNFMKSEVEAGSDLRSVATTVAETNIGAAKLDRMFASTYKVMEQLVDITAEGGQLSGGVIAEGGDESYLNQAHEKIAEAFQALKDAHMYAVKQAEED